MGVWNLTNLPFKEFFDHQLVVCFFLIDWVNWPYSEKQTRKYTSENQSWYIPVSLQQPTLTYIHYSALRVRIKSITSVAFEHFPPPSFNNEHIFSTRYGKGQHTLSSKYSNAQSSTVELFHSPWLQTGQRLCDCHWSWQFPARSSLPLQGSRKVPTRKCPYLNLSVKFNSAFPDTGHSHSSSP